MAIRPPKYNSQGYTLVEMLVVLIIAGIIMGLAVPSFLSLNKPLRNGSLQFKSQLALIRSKAISSNKAYRIRPRYATVAETIAAHSDPITLKPDRSYPQAPNNFIVEYAANCQVTTYGAGLAEIAALATSARPYNATYPNGQPDGWMRASQLDLDLPQEIGVSDTTPPIVGNPALITNPLKPANKTADISISLDSSLNWSICYDNRGIAFQTANVTLKDFQGNNRAVSASIQVGIVGDVDVTTKDKNNAAVPLNGDNPGF